MAKSSAARKEDTQEDFEAPIPDHLLPTLAALVAASSVKNGLLWMTEDASQPLVDAGFAMVNTNGPVNEEGAKQVRATEAGVEYSKEHPAVPNADYVVGGPAADVQQGRKHTPSGYVRPAKINVTTAVPPPTVRRGRTSGGEAYPFDKLEINGSFHIPSTPACEDPSKSMASSVNAANDKYSEERKDEKGEVIMTTARRKNDKTNAFEDKVVKKKFPTRRFILGKVGEDDPEGKGCRVWRVALDA